MTDTEYLKKFKLILRYHIKRAYRASIDPEDIDPQQLLDLLKDQNYLCYYCSTDISPKPSIDHIIPLSRGGHHSIENVQFVCCDCNSSKRNKIIFTPRPLNPSFGIEYDEDVEIEPTPYL